jgi:hypothetical protein
MSQTAKAYYLVGCEPQLEPPELDQKLYPELGNTVEGNRLTAGAKEIQFLVIRS